MYYAVMKKTLLFSMAILLMAGTAWGQTFTENNWDPAMTAQARQFQQLPYRTLPGDMVELGPNPFFKGDNPKPCPWQVISSSEENLQKFLAMGWEPFQIDREKDSHFVIRVYRYWLRKQVCHE